MAKSFTKKTIPFSFMERILVLSLIPKMGNSMQNVVRRDLIKKLEFTQSEIEKYEVKQVGDSVQWNKAGVDYRLDASLSDLEMNELKFALRKAEREEKLPMELTDMFMTHCK